MSLSADARYQIPDPPPTREKPQITQMNADEGACGYLRQSALSAVSPELSLQLSAYDSGIAAAGSGALLPPILSLSDCTTK